MVARTKDVNVLFPKSIDWETWINYKSESIFTDGTIFMLDALSKRLLKDPRSRLYPDVVTFGFFCRKGNLNKKKELYTSEALRLGRGIVFHIAPSNVPINFGYSLVSGLLAGNMNIVRVSSKEFPQVDIIVQHLLILAKEGKYNQALSRFALVKYNRMSEATAYFSSICQIRVIWGGNQTINIIRSNAIPPRSFDITFADRYSFGVINADKLVSETKLASLAESFYNDTYLFDQNACSAPHLIVWLGSDENKIRAKKLFWAAVHELVAEKYEFQSVMAVDKLSDMYSQSQYLDIHRVITEDNLVMRSLIDKLPNNIDEFRSKCGYFLEYDAISLDEVASIVKYNYQTLASYGVFKEELRRFVQDNHLIGIDRITPFGKTTAFDFIWDGYNLIETMSRECVILNQ